MSMHKKWISLILLVSLLLTIGARAETTLKLNGVSTKFSGDFAQRHPDVQLETGDYTYYATTGEMTSDMLLGSFNYDAFELSRTVSTIMQLWKKDIAWTCPAAKSFAVRYRICIQFLQRNV